LQRCPEVLDIRLHGSLTDVREWPGAEDMV
jgi:hypothetical protein